MREKNRKPIASIKKLPQFTTMNVIDGQAGLISYFSLIFYSLTIDNILNIIVLLILAGISIMTLTGDNGILKRATEAQEKTEEAKREEQEQLEQIDKYVNEYLNSQEKIQIVNFGDSIFGNYRSEYGSEESISALISEMTGKRCLNAGFGGCNMCQRDDLYGAFSMVSLSDSMVNNDWSAQKKAISDAKLSSEYSDSELANGYFLETVEM